MVFELQPLGLRVLLMTPGWSHWQGGLVARSTLPALAPHLHCEE
jgi:hypothetical protein